MDFEVQLAHSVQEVGQEAWDRLGQGQPFASYRWYHFGETVLTDDLPIYVILRRGNEAVARGTFWLKRRELLPIPSAAVRRVMQALLRRWPLLVCRAPLAATSGLVLPDPPLREAALATIVQVAQAQLQVHGGSFLLFDYLRGREVGWAGWPDALVSTMLPDPGTRLAITWSSFEEYVKQLPKSVRKDYRRHRNRAADLGIEVTRQPQVSAVDEALVLIRNVEAHHNSAPNPWARAILENASLVDAIWLTATVGERLVGCGLLLGDGDVHFLASLGLDYRIRYVYFQLVYAALRQAIDSGSRVLRGGGGVYDIKRRLGFQREDDNYVVFAGRGPLLERFGRWVATSSL